MKYLLILFFLLSRASANLPLNDLLFSNLPGGKTYSISTGNGFFVNNKVALTSAHVVKNCLNITIRDNKQNYAAKLFLADRKLDLALLIISGQVGDSALVSFIKSSATPLVDDLIFVKSDNYNLKQSRITKVENFLFEFSGNFESGASGSPVFDQHLNLIGILTAKIEIFDVQKRLLFKTNQAISIDQIANFISNKQISTGVSLKNLPSPKNNLFTIHCIRPEQQI